MCFKSCVKHHNDDKSSTPSPFLRSDIANITLKGKKKK